MDSSETITCIREKYNRPYASPLLINPCEFSKAVEKLRGFFHSKGFLEVHTQNRLSILAACEDPFNVSTFEYTGNTWPLPQTGQMWLEYELLKIQVFQDIFVLAPVIAMNLNPLKVVII